MNHYPTEGAAYAAARDANERQMFADRELRNAVESWYYAQKHLINIVECNRNLRQAWESLQDQARVVERLGPPPIAPRAHKRCHVCDASEQDQVGIEVYLCADHIPESALPPPPSATREAAK